MAKTVAVIFGGRSAEHDVSIVTAFSPIISSLKAVGKYNIVPVYISKSGDWYSSPALMDIRTFQRADLDAFLSKLPKLQLLFDDGLVLITPGIKAKKQKIEVVFPAMHGTYGEDGSLMGLLRMANVPFVGCDLAASAVAMDKVLTKQVTMSEGLSSVEFEWFGSSDWANHQKEVLNRIERLIYPLFVKPSHLGSSIAITKVADTGQLTEAIEVALHYDDKVIVEESVEDLIEVTAPIMGDEEEVQLALVERPLKGGFFDFEGKYMQGGKKKGGGANSGYSELPAKLDPKLYRQVEDMSRQTFRVLNASGIARIDFLIDAKSQKVYLNEVNTLPGGLYDHNWKAAGVSAVELVEKLITIAEKRHEKQRKLTFTFQSSFLQQF